MSFRFSIFTASLVLIAGAVIFVAPAQAATAVIASSGGLHDSDGDGVPDFTDNAPGVFNPAQNDLDGDQIGDVIDPLPTTVGPLINIAFAIGGTYIVAPGAGVSINYTVGTAPVGDFGHINLYLQPGITPDAYAFQSLATPGGSFFIPASLVTISGLWDLNTPGTYSMEAWAFGPGVNEGYKGGTATVIVSAPEPGALCLVCVCGIVTLRRRTQLHK